MTRDPSRVGQCMVGYCRVGVYTPRWEQALSRIWRSLTRRRKVWLNRDTTTGWFNIEWQEDSINGVLVEQGGSFMGLPAGIVMRMDAVLVTLDGFEPGWQVYDGLFDKYYEVQAIEEKRDPKDGGFAYRICHLHYLDLLN